MTVPDANHASIPLHLLYEEEFEQWRNSQNEASRNWAAVHGFKAERNKLLLLPPGACVPTHPTWLHEPFVFLSIAKPVLFCSQAVSHFNTTFELNLVAVNALN